MAPVSVTVRPLEPDDLPDVKAIFAQSVAHHAALDPLFAKTPDAPETWGDYVLGLSHDTPEARVLVALTEGGAVGYVIGRVTELPPIYPNRRIGFVSNIAVDADHRRLGVGRALFEALRAWFVEQAVDHIELNVATSNPLSMGYWAAMGGRAHTVGMVIELSRDA